ncbi:hypothetical protein IQ62_01655 [Streptomyces scabiei]|nr:hypothetical protein IQ62_01655 [Streptomyces scabiei]
MTPRLLFIHGIGGPRDRILEREIWAHALADGMREAGHFSTGDRLQSSKACDVDFAYYGDLFSPRQAQGVAGAEELDERAAVLLAAMMYDIVEEKWAETEAADPNAETQGRLLAYAREQARPTGQAQGVMDLVRRSLNVATTLLELGPLRRAGQWTAPKLLVRDLAQVARYLARSEPDAEGRTLDRRIRDRILSHLEGNDDDRPTVIVAHSLGTVVALETLHEHSVSVPLLVTLGSPLSMRTVVWPNLRPRPPRTPASVSAWLNFWDRDDVIAVRPELESDILPNAASVQPRSRRIDSDGLWVHTATKYLRQPAVAGPVAAALAGVSDFPGNQAAG